MSQPIPGTIALTVTPHAAGGCICEVTLELAGRTNPTRQFHGQTQDHALAIALEALAREFRTQAEAEQNVPWEVVDRPLSGKARKKRFHVTLHYECVAEEESKFEAMHNTLLGNTIVENAEVAIVQVDPGLPKPGWKRRGD